MKETVARNGTSEVSLFFINEILYNNLVTNLLISSILKEETFVISQKFISVK